MDKNKHFDLKKIFNIFVLILMHIGYIMIIGGIAYLPISVGNIGATIFAIGIGVLFYAFIAWIILINID